MTDTTDTTDAPPLGLVPPLDDTPILGFGDLLRGDDAELASKLIDTRCPGDLAPIYSEGAYREYDPPSGVWTEIDESELSRTVQSFAGLSVGGKKRLKVSAGTVSGTIKLARDLVSNPNFFDQGITGITFNNGFVEVCDGKITTHRHTSDQRARHRVDIDYEPGALHPELDQFWDDVFADTSEEERSARVMLIQEFTGACLIGKATSYQRCLVFEGPGGNGKSQAEEIIRSVFPPRTVCSLPPQQWGERFQIAKLVGCLANIVDEIPEKEIVSGDLFKSVITGEPVHTERKHRDPFEHRPVAGHLFSANLLPSTADLSHGFFRRFLIVKFTRDMERAPGSRKDIGRYVVTLDRAGIAAWAVEGAARLQRQGGYTIPQTSTDAVNEWRRASDSVAMFVDEATRPNDPMLPTNIANGTRASTLYSAYRQWTISNGYRCVSSKNFANRMDALKLRSVQQSDARYHPVLYVERGGPSNA